MKQEYDSSDDEDYVPSEDAVSEHPHEKSSEEELDGIAALKERKRNREVDDLFELMN